MEIIRTVDEMQSYADSARPAGNRLALVPTMGALHGGHLSLVSIAKEHADRVVVSIYVNPTQFGPDEDFDEYPRELEQDAEKLRGEGVDVVFAPTAKEMYPHSDSPERTAPLTWVEVDEFDDVLCGKYREGHFRGVTTIVTKLFNACKPHLAVFGQKDAQQLAILRRMTSELLFDIEIIGGPIVRESDGLAMSSRNAYLSDEHRQEATVLFDAVTAAESAILDGEQDATRIVRAMRNELGKADAAEVQYAEVVDARTLAPVDTLSPGQDILAAVAVYFGDTRLIDNTIVPTPA
jgi:pantoate--beta-alanine ligase